jgi:hypothetical protein
MRARHRSCGSATTSFSTTTPRNRPWEYVIVEDFAEFRKAGFTHPMMADVEKELGVSP